MSELSVDSSMETLLAAYPGGRRALFTRYHIGGCASCGFDPSETLAAVCARSEGVNPAEALEHLRASHEADLKLLVAPAELAAELKDGAVALVDIRSREEFDTARIEGASLFTQDLMQEMMASWDRSAPVVFVDHQGARSLDAAAYFAGHGFTRARALRGGIDAWSAEVDPDVPRYRLN